MRIALAAALVPCLAASAVAGDLKVPSDDYPNIQAAADAAQPGDRIVVAKGIYNESVEMTQDGVTFLGKGAIWDGGPNSACLYADGDGLVVQGFAFRNGGGQVQLVGNDCVVKKCTFTGAGDYALAWSGIGFSVSACRFRGNSAAISTSGPGAVVSACLVQQCDSDAISIDGDGAVVEKNRITNCDGGRSIVLNGATCRIARNTILGSTATALRVDGVGAVLEGNSITVVDDAGIFMTGEGATVTGNRVTACVGLSIYVIGDNAVVDGNRVLWVQENGITVNGDSYTVTGNSVAHATNNSYAFALSPDTPAGSGTCTGNTASDTAYWGFYVSSSGAVVADNKALRCGSGGDGGFWLTGMGIQATGNLAQECDGDGFRIDGSTTVLVRCTAKDSTGDGFEVNGDGVRVEACVASGSGGEGLDNDGLATDAVGNRFLGNRIDVANGVIGGATFDEFTGNAFVTGGITTEPEID